MLIFASRVLATLTSTFLVYLILRKPRSKPRIFFAVGILFVLLWNGFDAMSSLLPSDAYWESGARILVAVILTSIAYGSFFLSLSFFYFDSEEISSFQNFISMLPLFTIPFLWLFFIPNVEYVVGIGWEIIEDMTFFVPFIIAVLIPMIYGFSKLLRIYHKIPKGQRGDMTYFLVGLFCTIFFPTLIDGILSVFTVVSYGSVGVAVGCAIMSIPYFKSRFKGSQTKQTF